MTFTYCINSCLVIISPCARDRDRRVQMAYIVSFIMKSLEENWIMMVKAHCVVITATSYIVICERIMKLQPSKKMNLANES